MIGRRYFAGAFLFLLAVAIAKPISGQTYEGRELVKAQLIADTDAIAPGKTFTPEGLAKDVHELWDSGLFADIEVDLKRGDDGVYIDGIDVTETSDVVTFIAREQDKVFPPSPNYACIDIGLEVKADITLNAPLGERRLEGCYASDVSHGETPAGSDCRATLR